MRTILTVLLIASFLFNLHAQKVPKSKKLKTEPEYTIDLYSAFKNTKVYQLSLITEKIEYIPLEKTDKCLLGEHVKSFYFDEEFIFVFDFEKCYRFTRKGKFVNTIGKKGRGPGEYNRPMSIAIDTKQKLIYFQDRGRLLKYNYNGDFIKEYQIGVTTSKILQYNENIFLVNRMMYSYAKPGSRFSIYFFSEIEEKLIARFECPKKDKIPFAIDTPTMYNYGGNTFVKDFWENTVFKVENPQTMAPYAFLNTGKLKHRDKDDKSPFTGKKNKGDELVISVTFMSETERYIFISANKGLFVFDKTNGKTYCSEYQKNGEKWYALMNDINGGPTFFANNFPKYHLTNNTLVTFNHAYEFFEEGVDTNNHQIKELLKTLQPDDNPVLVLVKLKE